MPEENMNTSPVEPMEPKVEVTVESTPPEEPKVPKKKSNTLAIVLLVILAILGIGFGVYGMFFFNASENFAVDCPKCDCPSCAENEADCPKCEEQELNKSVIYESIRKFIDFGGEYGLTTPTKYLDRDFVNKAMSSDINKLGYVFNLSKFKIGTSDERIRYSKVNERFREIFGYDAPKARFTDYCMTYEYDAKDDSFVMSDGGCGGIYFGRIMYFVDSVSKNGENMVVDLITVEAITDIEDPSEPTVVKYSDGSKEIIQCSRDELTNNRCSAINQAFAEKNTARLPHLLVTTIEKDGRLVLKTMSVK